MVDTLARSECAAVLCSSAISTWRSLRWFSQLIEVIFALALNANQPLCEPCAPLIRKPRMSRATGVSLVRQAILAPCIAETARRIVGDRPAVANPAASNERLATLRWLARPSFKLSKPMGSPRPMMFMHTSPANSIRPGRHSSATCPAQCPGV